MKKLILLPSFFIALTSFAQTKLIIQSNDEKCAVVQNQLADVAIGDPGYFSANYNFQSVQEIARGFLQFDLSAIPQGSKINWARLTLFGASQSGFNSSKLRRVTSAWDWKTVTWNTQPTTTKRGQVSLPNSTSANENYKNINVTNLVQAMVDSPAASFGFAIKLDTEFGKTGADFIKMTFYSAGQLMLHKDPKLVIEYTTPGLQKQEVTTLSVDLGGQGVEMNIYPNPCSGIFNCNIKSAAVENMTLKVMDILGRTVYSRPVNSSGSQLRVNLPPGSAATYFVILQDNKMGNLISQQLQVN